MIRKEHYAEPNPEPFTADDLELLCRVHAIVKFTAHGDTPIMIALPEGISPADERKAGAVMNKFMTMLGEREVERELETVREATTTATSVTTPLPPFNTRFFS